MDRGRAGSQGTLELVDEGFVKVQVGMFDHPSKSLFHPVTLAMSESNHLKYLTHQC